MAPLAHYDHATLALASTFLATPAPVPGSKVIRAPAEAALAAGVEIHINRFKAQGGWENHIKRNVAAAPGNEVGGGMEIHIKRNKEARGGYTGGWKWTKHDDFSGMETEGG